uniref:Uncharacterized protein n=1 Tax=Timema cristinae TaxID=61476 RepID=A0A7R9DFZ8_TIMCR|nr:unnamed protein product [Timema cristinae]
MKACIQQAQRPTNNHNTLVFINNLVASLKREAFEDFQLGDNEEVLGAFNKKRFADLNQSPQVRMQVKLIFKMRVQELFCVKCGCGIKTRKYIFI